MTDPSGAPGCRIVSLGGGHGLYQTLRAVRSLNPEQITAIVTVADDGGSSGRLRRELGIIPPGDLRMALAALAGDRDEDQMWARLLQHRFGGTGALAGHAVGNLILAGLTEVLDNTQAALDATARLTNSTGRVLPMALEPLDIEADVSGLDDDPRIMRIVRGQVAVASTPGIVRRVRLIPDPPAANQEAVAAIHRADIVTLGPGSWFSSVIPHLLVPGINDAINETTALKIIVLNLTAESGETTGFSHERHLHMLSQHASELRVDRVLADASVLPNAGERRYLEQAAERIGATVVYDDIRALSEDGRQLNIHDPERMAGAIRRIHDTS